MIAGTCTVVTCPDLAGNGISLRSTYRQDNIPMFKRNKMLVENLMNYYRKTLTFRQITPKG